MSLWLVGMAIYSLLKKESDMKNIYVLFLVLFYTSCEKANINIGQPPSGSDKDEVKVIWYSWISDKKDTFSRFSLKPVIYKNTVITSDLKYFRPEDEVLSAFEKHSGKLLWKWKDYYSSISGNEGIYFGDTKVMENGKLYWAGEGSYYSINVENGTTCKKIKSLDFGPTDNSFTHDFNVKDGLSIQSYGFPDLPFPDSLKFCLLDHEFNLTKSFTLMRMGEWYPHGVYTRVCILENDTLIIAPVRWLRKDSVSIEKSDVFCYSLNSDSIIWHYGELDKHISKSTLINQNKFYFVAGSDFYCLDILTGRLVWKRSLNLPQAYRFVDPLTIADGKIFARNSIGDTYCLNASNGLVVWANTLDEETGASGFAEGAKIEYYKGRLYFSDNILHVLDALSGRLIKKYKVPRSVPQYSQNYIEGITIDPETDLMYFTDGYHLICAKVPE